MFSILKSKLGSDENVSSIISIRSEGGSSSSAIPRKAFSKLINNTEVYYKENRIVINNNNYTDYRIKQIARGGTGNEKWEGFIFVSIKGGQQDTIETHHGEEMTIFNPACEYASKNVRVDLDLVASYFMMQSINVDELDEKTKNEHNAILTEIKECLHKSYYKSEAYEGTLLDYCNNHPCLKLNKGHLTDPIQLKNIGIENFNIEHRTQDSVDFTHGEAVTFEKYYWDEAQNTILSPARPANVFWSFHLSNMMQQDYSLNQYFEYEKERYEKRQRLLNEE